jgi:hypothetical protein
LEYPRPTVPNPVEEIGNEFTRVKIKLIRTQNERVVYHVKIILNNLEPSGFADCEFANAFGLRSTGLSSGFEGAIFLGGDLFV